MLLIQGRKYMNAPILRKNKTQAEHKPFCCLQASDQTMSILWAGSMSQLILFLWYFSIIPGIAQALNFLKINIYSEQLSECLSFGQKYRNNQLIKQNLKNQSLDIIGLFQTATALYLSSIFLFSLLFPGTQWIPLQNYTILGCLGGSVS